jgi:hypothetical protein
VLPTAFAIVQGGAGRQSASLDPFDPASAHYRPEDANGDGLHPDAPPVLGFEHPSVSRPLRSVWEDEDLPDPWGPGGLEGEASSETRSLGDPGGSSFP